MADIAELHDQLIAMPRSQYSELIKSVDFARRRQLEERETARPPAQGISRDDFATWIAQRHFEFDKGITQIVYLPDDAADGEVRLLEVNDLANIPEAAPIVAVDFMPDIEGIHYDLFVADATPRQWEEVQAKKLTLPTGWSLKDSRILITDKA